MEDARYTPAGWCIIQEILADAREIGYSEIEPEFWRPPVPLPAERATVRGSRHQQLAFFLIASVSLAFGCQYETVYFSFGQHVDFYHSYRGDSPDEEGFGKDIRVITETLNILENYPMVKMSWEFDSWQTLEQRLPDYAPELFDRIKARIAEKDEVRFQSWSGSVVSAETPEEFAASIGWQRQNLLDMFGKVENGVYPQEMMHTPSLIRAYGDLGIEWVSLFYSASSFTAFRNEVLLSGRELYNPLWLETPEGDARMIVLPTYHHADVADFLGMAAWANYVGTNVPGDSLIFVDFDADGESWPLILKLFLPQLVRRPFVKFCTPGEYIAGHEPVGTIVLHRDQADGVFDGYSSWAEKPINHEIWTAVEASRLDEGRTRFLQQRFGLQAPEISTLLEDNFRWRLQTMKTTHFGLATPQLHPDRVARAREHAERIRTLSSQALGLARAEAEPAILGLVGAPPSLPYTGTSRPYYICRPDGPSGPSLVRIPLAFAEGEAFSGGIRVYRNGQEVPSCLLDVSLYTDGSVEAATIVFVTDLGAEEEAIYWISRSDDPGVGEPEYGLVPAGSGLLDNGRVSLAFDLDGWPVSFQRDGLEFSAGRLLDPGITYQGIHAGPAEFEPDVSSGNVRERGFAATQAASGQYQVLCDGQPVDASVHYEFRLYAGLPFVEVRAEAVYPALGEACAEDLSEAYPLGLRPALSGYGLCVWKHNYFDYTSSYDITQPAGSLNNHVTASWVALSDESLGVLVAYDAEQQAGLAFCPIKVEHDSAGQLRPLLNPFGTLWGALPNHDALRTGGLGIGETMTVLLGAQFHPTGPAYAGTTTRFSVILLPYPGDEPPTEEQELAEAYSYPPLFIALPEP